MASGTADLQRDLGGAIMQSIFGALLTAGYAAARSHAIAGAPSADQITDSVQAQLTKSFSSAEATAEQYPQYADQIIAGAKTSFLDGADWAYMAGSSRSCSARRSCSSCSRSRTTRRRSWPIPRRGHGPAVTPVTRPTRSGRMLAPRCAISASGHVLNGREPMSTASSLDAARVESLSASFGGRLLQPGDEGYDIARHVHNGLIDRRPALIVRCRGAARRRRGARSSPAQCGLEVSVRGGGHNVAGRAVDRRRR